MASIFYNDDMPSTVIKSMSYDPARQRLRIVYISGTVYDYKKVPQAVYDEMKAAFSKGTFLNQHIKGQYAYDKIR
ncbi:MAG: KTSC domain-containing protein [Bacteroidota bacterium]